MLNRLRLRDQMQRLFRAQISFDESSERGQRWLDMQMLRAGNSGGMSTTRARGFVE